MEDQQKNIFQPFIDQKKSVEKEKMNDQQNIQNIQNQVNSNRGLLDDSSSDDEQKQQQQNLQKDQDNNLNKQKLINEPDLNQVNIQGQDKQIQNQIEQQISVQNTNENQNSLSNLNNNEKNQIELQDDKQQILIDLQKKRNLINNQKIIENLVNQIILKKQQENLTKQQTKIEVQDNQAKQLGVKFEDDSNINNTDTNNIEQKQQNSENANKKQINLQTLTIEDYQKYLQYINNLQIKGIDPSLVEIHDDPQFYQQYIDNNIVQYLQNNLHQKELQKQRQREQKALERKRRREQKEKIRLQQDNEILQQLQREREEQSIKQIQDFKEIDKSIIPKKVQETKDQNDQQKLEQDEFILQCLLEEVKQKEKRQLRSQIKDSSIKQNVLIEGEGNMDIEAISKKKKKGNTTNKDLAKKDDKSIASYQTKAPDILLNCIDEEILKKDAVGVYSKDKQNIQIDEIELLQQKNFRVQSTYELNSININLENKFKFNENISYDFPFILEIIKEKNENKQKIIPFVKIENDVIQNNELLNQANNISQCQNDIQNFQTPQKNNQKDSMEIENSNEKQQSSQKTGDEFNKNNNNTNSNSNSKQSASKNNTNSINISAIQNLEQQKFQIPNFPEELLNKLKKSKINSMYQIRNLAEQNFYVTFEQFLKDYYKVILKTLIFRCKSLRSYLYILNLNESFQKIIKQYQDKYNNIKNLDLDKLYKYDLQNKLECKDYPFIPKQFRQYEPINDYKAQHGTLKKENDVIFQKLKSGKQVVQCEENCQCQVENHRDLGDFSLEKMTYVSNCPNRNRRMECDCEDSKNCKNMPCQKQQNKVLGEHVQETICWGLDLYTRKNIYHVLQESDTVEQKANYITYTLHKAANLLKENGWNIVNVLEFIINNSPKYQDITNDIQEQIKINEEKIQKQQEENQLQNENQQKNCENKDQNQENTNKESIQMELEDQIQQQKLQQNTQINKENNITSNQQKIQISDIYQDSLEICKDLKKQDFYFTYRDRIYSKHLLKIVNLNVDKEAFRFHSKGMGVICMQKNGIQKNDFITKYVGEIYSPWRWFERQDFTKKFLKEANEKDSLPDFYNIQLEIHKDDPKGYDILFVDPILKGNYSSRFSHSCDPNCGTVTNVSQGKYMIGMYSMKDIQYGEELCFDYSAVTESRAEHKQAYCLCGANKCRGKYLQLSNSNNKEFNFLLEQNNCFLKRNSDLLVACSQEFNDKDKQILDAFNLRENVLNGAPLWLQKWMCITLDGIQREGQQYFDALMKQQYSFQFQTINTFLPILPPVIQDNQQINLQLDQQQQITSQNQVEDKNINDDKIINNIINTKENQLNETNIENNNKTVLQNTTINNEQNPDLINNNLNQDSQTINNNNSQIEEEEGNQQDTLNKQNDSKIQEEDKEQIQKAQQNIEIEENNQEKDQKIEQIFKNNEQLIQKTEQAIKNQENIENPEIINLVPVQQQQEQLNFKEFLKNQIEINLKTNKQEEILKYNEITLLNKQQILDNNPGKEDKIDFYKFWAMERIESRLQNLVITVDKIKYFLQKSGDFEKPLEQVSQQDTLTCILGEFDENEDLVGRNNNYSIIGEFYDLLKSYENFEECKKAIQFTKKIYIYVKNIKDVQIQLLITRIYFLYMSQYFRKMEKSTFHYYGLQTIMYMMAFTHTFFTNHEYPNIVSEKMVIRDNEIFNLEMMEKKKNKKEKFEESRMYSPQFVWGQLIAWFKQTVANPHASLSQDRRGTLSFPVLNSSFQTPITTWPFQEKNDTNSRKSFLDHLSSKPKDSWPPDYAKWSFKNSQKFYGTLVFEGLHNQKKFPNMIQIVLENIDSEFSKKKDLFIIKEEVIENLSQEIVQKYLDEIQEILNKFEIQIPEQHFIDPSQPLDRTEKEETDLKENISKRKKPKKSQLPNKPQKNITRREKLLLQNKRRKNRRSYEFDTEEDDISSSKNEDNEEDLNEDIQQQNNSVKKNKKNKKITEEEEMDLEIKFMQKQKQNSNRRNRAISRNSNNNNINQKQQQQTNVNIDRKIVIDINFSMQEGKQVSVKYHKNDPNQQDNLQTQQQQQQKIIQKQQQQKAISNQKSQNQNQQTSIQLNKKQQKELEKLQEKIKLQQQQINQFQKKQQQNQNKKENQSLSQTNTDNDEEQNEQDQDQEQSEEMDSD